MPAPKRVRIGDLLVEHKIISEAQLQAALADQKKSGRKLGRVLIENGFVKEDMLLELLSRQLAIPFIDLTSFELNPEQVQKLPETYARRYRAIVLKGTVDGGLLLGMGDPTDIFAYDELVRILKSPVQLAVVKESDLLHCIDRFYQHGAQLKSLASEVGQDLADSAFDLGQLGIDSDPERCTGGAAAADAVQGRRAVGNVSDIHIEPEEDGLRIRMRIDGVL